MPYRYAAIFLTTTLLIAFGVPHHSFGGRAQAAEIRTAPGITYSVFASGLKEPRGLLITPKGDFYAVEEGGGSVVKVGFDGALIRIAKGLAAPHDLALEPEGDLLVADAGNNRIARIKPSGQIETYISGLSTPV